MELDSQKIKSGKTLNAISLKANVGPLYNSKKAYLSKLFIETSCEGKFTLLYAEFAIFVSESIEYSFNRVSNTFIVNSL